MTKKEAIWFLQHKLSFSITRQKFPNATATDLNASSGVGFVYQKNDNLDLTLLQTAIDTIGSSTTVIPFYMFYDSLDFFVPTDNTAYNNFKEIVSKWYANPSDNNLSYIGENTGSSQGSPFNSGNSYGISNKWKFFTPNENYNLSYNFKNNTVNCYALGCNVTTLGSVKGLGYIQFDSPSIQGGSIWSYLGTLLNNYYSTYNTRVKWAAGFIINVDGTNYTFYVHGSTADLYQTYGTVIDFPRSLKKPSIETSGSNYVVKNNDTTQTIEFDIEYYTAGGIVGHMVSQITPGSTTSPILSTTVGSGSYIKVNGKDVGNPNDNNSVDGWVTYTSYLSWVKS